MLRLIHVNVRAISIEMIEPSTDLAPIAGTRRMDLHRVGTIRPNRVLDVVAPAVADADQARGPLLITVVPAHLQVDFAERRRLVHVVLFPGLSRMRVPLVVRLVIEQVIERPLHIVE